MRARVRLPRIQYTFCYRLYNPLPNPHYLPAHASRGDPCYLVYFPNLPLWRSFTLFLLGTACPSDLPQCYIDSLPVTLDGPLPRVCCFISQRPVRRFLPILIPLFYLASRIDCFGRDPSLPYQLALGMPLPPPTQPCGTLAFPQTVGSLWPYPTLAPIAFCYALSHPFLLPPHTCPLATHWPLPCPCYPSVAVPCLPLPFFTHRPFCLPFHILPACVAHSPLYPMYALPLLLCRHLWTYLLCFCLCLPTFPVLFVCHPSLSLCLAGTDITLCALQPATYPSLLPTHALPSCASWTALAPLFLDLGGTGIRKDGGPYPACPYYSVL